MNAAPRLAAGMPSGEIGACGRHPTVVRAFGRPHPAVPGTLIGVDPEKKKRSARGPLTMIGGDASLAIVDLTALPDVAGYRA